MTYKRRDESVSVIPPQGFAEAFKRLALERTVAADPKSKRRRVWAQDLHEEAVRAFLLRLSRGEKVVFVTTPFRNRKRKSMWLDAALYAEVKEGAARWEISISTVVLTACLEFLKAHGIDLELT